MALQKTKAHLLIYCVEQWVWRNTMTLSVVHQNSTWLMIMPSDLLLVLQNARYGDDTCSNRPFHTDTTLVLGGGQTWFILRLLVSIGILVACGHLGPVA